MKVPLVEAPNALRLSPFEDLLHEALYTKEGIESYILTNSSNGWRPIVFRGESWEYDTTREHLPVEGEVKA